MYCILTHRSDNKKGDSFGMLNRLKPAEPDACALAPWARICYFALYGGDERSRTSDLNNVNVAL